MPVVETDWSAIQSGLIAWVEGITGRSAYWRDDRRFIGEGAPVFYLHIQSIEERGQPGIEYEAMVDPETSQQVLVPSQKNMIDISIEVSCVTNDQFPGAISQQEMQRLRARCRIPQFGAPLEQAGLALMDSRIVASIPFEYHGRTMSQSNAEFLFSAVEVFRDTSITESYFDSVNNAQNTPDLSDVNPFFTKDVIFTEGFDFVFTEDDGLIISD